MSLLEHCFYFAILFSKNDPEIEPVVLHTMNPVLEGGGAGVDILAFPQINIVEINKQFDETWKGIRKIRHF